MEMAQIRYFLTVCETLNFTRAAEQCCISQPALTKAIKKLESTIGGQLFCRSNSSVTLSGLGKALLPHFMKISQGAKRTEQTASRLLANQADPIRVGVQSNIPVDALFEQLNLFRRQYPEVDITFCHETQNRLKQKYEEHALDIVFMSEFGDGRPTQAEVAYEEPLVVIFGQNHRFNDFSKLTLADLNYQRFCRREHCECSVKALSLFCKNRVIFDVVYSISTDDWLSLFLDQDDALAVVPLSTALKEGYQYLSLGNLGITRRVIKKHRNLDGATETQRLLSSLNLMPEFAEVLR